jgi:tetratricopeptide (TPR) repeat protein
MEIEHILEEIRQKLWEHSFAQEDAVKLEDAIKQFPCHLEAQLSLIENAQQFEHVFPHSWKVYYQNALEKGTSCWKKEELAEIYFLGSQLYFYDQDNSSGRAAIAKAFEFSPSNWRIIIGYLGTFRESMTPDTELQLIYCITQPDPAHARAYFVQGRHFEEYAARYSRLEYRDAALKAYRRSLELATLMPQHGIPPRAPEEAIKRLSKPSDEQSPRSD